MKRLSIICLIIALCMLLAACGTAGNTAVQNSGNSSGGSSEADSVSGNVASQGGNEKGGNDMNGAENSKALVVYFSRVGEQYGVGVIEKGNTEIVAEMIAERIGADLFEVKPVDDYYPMEYSPLCDVAKKELNENARPEYLKDGLDLSQYDTIFIGAPVWWGDWPMIMYTFFESEDLAGKTLAPFSTHAGSGLSGFDRKLAAACPDSAVTEGLGVAGSEAQNNPDSARSKVNDWLSGLGY